MINLTNQGLMRPPQSASLEGTTSTISTAQSKFGTHSLYLGGTGTGDWVTSRRGMSNLFSGFGTVEFFFYNTGTNYPLLNNIIYDIQEVSTETVIFLKNNNTLWARTRFGATTYATAEYALNAVNNWNHIAITLEDNVYLTLWINGEKKQTIGNGTDTLVTSGGNWQRFGAQSPTAYYNEYRMSKIARYDSANSTYTVPTAPFVSDSDTHWLFHFDENDSPSTKQCFDDVILSGPFVYTPLTYTVAGTPTMSTSEFKVGTSSGQFTDVADYLYGNDNRFNIGTSDFTVEFWSYFTATPVYGGVFSTVTNPGVNGFKISNFNGNVVGQIGYQDDVFYGDEVEVVGGFTTGTWQHIAFVRDATNIRVYVDGVETATSTNTNLDLTTTDFGIATDYFDFNQGPLNGYLDEIRVSDIARYTAGFTPSTTGFTADENTLLLAKMEGANGSSNFVDGN